MKFSIKIVSTSETSRAIHGINPRDIKDNGSRNNLRALDLLWSLPDFDRAEFRLEFERRNARNRDRSIEKMYL